MTSGLRAITRTICILIAICFCSVPAKTDAIAGLRPQMPLVISDPAGNELTLAESFSIRLTVKGDGIPLSVKSEKPLPDYVVHSIMNWRFEPFGSGTDQRNTAFPIRIRRKVTPELESEMVFGFKVGPEVKDINSQMKVFDDTQAEAIAANLPPNEEPDLRRSTLIAYYARSPSPENEAKRIPLVLWMIENYPQAEILSTSYAAILPANHDAINQADKFWIAALRTYPNDERVLRNAVLGTYFPGHASIYETARSAGVPPDPIRDAEIAGTSAAWRGLGVTSINLKNGRALATQGLDDAVVQTILAQRDPYFVLPAVKLFTRFGAALQAAGVAPANYMQVCGQLVAHARELYPNTSSTCGPAAARASREDVNNPQILARIAPQYSKEARKEKLRGLVILSAIVTKEGTVRDVELVSGALPFYDTAAAALLRWTFKPGMHDGSPVDVRVTVQIQFRLI